MSRELRWLCLLATLLVAFEARAQDLGHKFPGGVGIDAGVQSPQGIYLADRFSWYAANRAKDRNGDEVPIGGFDLDAVADALGVLGTWKVPHGPWLSAVVSGPLSRLASSTEDPRTSIDRFGFGDLYVMPLKVGWRFDRFDVVGSYGMYIPTGQFEARTGKGVGRGFWTHQFSFGGAAFFDAKKRGRVSFLASYDLNEKKRGIDVTRGDTAQVQGGAGMRLMQILDLGVAGYALWQVRADRGADLPVLVRGARDQVYGVGPEVKVLVPRLRTSFGARYEWDFAARSRPEGHLLVVSVDFAAYQPK